MPATGNPVTLTDKYLKALKPSPDGKRRVVLDALVPGLQVRVTGHGQISFNVVKRRPRKGGHFFRKIGNYPTWSISVARQEAREILLAVSQGKDPQAEEKAQRRAAEEEKKNRFAAVAQRYMRHLTSSDRPPRPTTQRNYRSYLTNHLIPALGDKPVSTITRTDVIAVIDAARERSGASSAIAVKSLLNAILNYAADRALITASPAAGLRARSLIGATASRDRVLSDEELRRVWAAFPSAGEPYASIDRLLLRTGCRLGEIAEMSWPELDLDKATLTVPAERSKNHLVNIVALSPAAVEIIRAQPRFTGGDFVFSTTDGRSPITAFSHAKRRLDRALGDGFVPFTIHDLRRTVRTKLSELGVASEVGEAVLGHVKGGVEGTYNRYRYIDEKRAALTRWEAHLDGIVNGEPTDKIVVLPRR